MVQPSIPDPIEMEAVINFFSVPDNKNLIIYKALYAKRKDLKDDKKRLAKKVNDAFENTLRNGLDFNKILESRIDLICSFLDFRFRNPKDKDAITLYEQQFLETSESTCNYHALINYWRYCQSSSPPSSFFLEFFLEFDLQCSLHQEHFKRTYENMYNDAEKEVGTDEVDMSDKCSGCSFYKGK